MTKLYTQLCNQQAILSVIGLGYVGMPIAVAFAKKGINVIGFDLNKAKIELYKSGIDPTQEVGNEAIKKTTVQFTSNEKDLQKASKLSFATDLFYNAGRAVPWFMIIVTALKESPSSFLSDFTYYLQEKNYLQKSLKGEEIQKLQKDFVSKKFSEKRLSKILPAALDLIELNGALGLCSAEGKESVISLNYHPDDLMSGYACDLHFFSANAGKQKNKTRVFVGNDGPDWALVK